MRISLSNLPSPNREYVVDFPRLDGGLNTWELDYRLDANESPEMLNLWWQDGALCSRDGQSRLTAEGKGIGYSAYESLFWDHGFFHIGDGLYCAKLTDADLPAGELELTQFCEGIPENRGSWFRFGDHLYYKNRGGYYRIKYQGSEAETLFIVENVLDTAYVPVIQINTEPTTGAGDTYQPENRLQPTKIVRYSPAEDVRDYQLPVNGVDSVESVTINGSELTRKTPTEMEELRKSEDNSGNYAPSAEPPRYFAVKEEEGLVLFERSPNGTYVSSVNTVEITYTKENKEAMAAIMDCPYAITYGGSQEVCVVMGGCPAQPNAYFWSGNHAAMDPGYFPISQYNLAGATEEKITGFGKQQGMLVIFKEGSVGRAVMGTQEMASGRVLITMDYTAINSRVGCDLPGTIQLVENNLVFANREQGVHLVADSSAAYENNIVHISRKVDKGLLKAVRTAEHIASFDDGVRYWLVAGGEVYAWDYTLSGYKEPSWFLFDNIRGIAFLMGDQAEYQLTADGHVDIYRRNFADYEGAIRKKYRFAAQNFGGYDRLKDVSTVLFAVRGDTDTDMEITYVTDYEKRKDRTNLRAFSWRLSPRNLAYRYLGVNRFAAVLRRRPGCRHIRHFTMMLENNEHGQDMSVISAQIYYNYQGRDR